MSKPLIAKVRRYAYGRRVRAGPRLRSDHRRDDAQFALPEVKLGLVAGAGGVFRLTRQMPFRAALGHLMTGRPMSAARALEFGLINEVVPAGELDACVRRWANEVLACAPLAVRSVKEAAWRSAGLTLEEAFGTRFAAEEARAASSDAREGPAAFVAKRTPRWTGR